MQTLIIPNFNNKLNSDVFLQIADAPEKPYMESTLPITRHISEFISSGPVSLTAINNANKPAIQFEAALIDFVRCELWQLTSAHTYCSHGVDRETFIKNYQSENLSRKLTDPMAVYIYKKIK